MGRRRTQLEPEPEPTPEILGTPDELEQAIAGLPQDSSVITLYRIPDQGKARYVTKLTPEDFDLEQIKRQFGGGRFRYTALQDGIKVQHGTFEIEGEPVLGGARREEASPVSREVAALTEKLERLVDTLGARPQSDFQEKLLTILLEDRKSRGGLDPELVAAILAAARGGGGGEPSQASQLTMLLDAIKQGMMLSGGGGTHPLIYAIEKLTPSIEKTVNALTSQPGAKPAVPEKPALVPQVSEAFRPFIPLIRPYLAGLISAASVNSNPESWADIIEDTIPQKEQGAMRSWLSGDTWFSDLCALDRRISLQAGWWNTLRGILLEPGEAPVGEEEEPEPEAA